MALSGDQETSFIELWSEKPCLHHVNSKLYSNKIEKDKLGLTANAVNKTMIPSLRCTQYALTHEPMNHYSLARLHIV